MKIGCRNFDAGTYCMGILNVTPDSFFDGGKYAGIDAALKQAEQMIADGADILDVGGESTRPGYTEVSASEETERVLPILQKIKERFDIPLSLDTSKAEVAREGIRVGVDLINNVRGTEFDSEMAQAVAVGGVAVCLMHNSPIGEKAETVSEVLCSLRENTVKYLDVGVKHDKIIIDPGVGFCKDTKQNLAVLRELKQFCEIAPVLIGVSNKSVVGNTLNLPVTERAEGTLAVSVLAALSGVRFVRVHDVKANVRALRMIRAIIGGTT